MTGNRPARPRRRKAYVPAAGCFGFFILLALAGAILFLVIPLWAASMFGVPASGQNPIQRVQNSARVLLWQQALTLPSQSSQQTAFEVQAGESPYSIAENLKNAGLIPSADAFIAYLKYSGKDTALQQGLFELPPGLTTLQTVERLLNPLPNKGRLVVLPGWRIEEIAESLPTSGYEMAPEEFITLAYASDKDRTFAVAGGSLEGMLFPGEYAYERDISASQLIDEMVARFEAAITPEMAQGWADQGLSGYEALVLASVLQREAVIAEEQGLMAGVFLNRLAIGMKLDTDPTVQYAAANLDHSGGWWRVPVTSADLQVDSVYNTYLYAGLPPTPICNPGLPALIAVAAPQPSSHLYFQAKCDGSGYHNFADSFEEHLANSCR